MSVPICPFWSFFRQKLRDSFCEGSFRKGVRVPIGVLGGGVWGQVQGVGAVPVENNGRGEGGGRVGGGVGTGKGTGKSMRKLCRNYPLANYPLVSPQFFFYQRAENGGLDLSWLDFAFLGRPDFPSRGPKTLV